MKPLISYYGGKQRIASKIIPYIPKHTVYVEPFCGGATVLFKKPEPVITNTHHYREVLNDTSGLLVNMYRVFQTRPKELTYLLEHTLYSRKEYHKAKDICQGKIDADDLWKAWAYYINIQMSFSNKLNGGWGTAVVGPTPSLTFNSKIENLKDPITRIRTSHIEDVDALECIKKWDSPQSFFYCDPPYPGTNQGHYKGYSLKDFQNLVDTLEGIRGSFILSCYNNDDVVIPDNWKKVEINATCSARGRVRQDRSREYDESKQNRKRTEVLYMRLGKAPVKPELQKLYDSGKFDCFTGDKLIEEME